MFKIQGWLREGSDWIDFLSGGQKGDQERPHSREDSLGHGGQIVSHEFMITANTCTLLSMCQVLSQALYIY